MLWPLYVGMSATDLISTVTDSVRNAAVESVYGDPVERDGRTVVPVAKVAFGFGAGQGTGEDEEGAGGGGGGAAKPVGALEITDDGTRFVRFGNRRRWAAVAAAALALGYLAGRLTD